MISLGTPPRSPILEGARHPATDCEPMLAVNTPSQSPVLKIADRQSCIWVSYEVEVIHEVGDAHDAKIKYEVEARHEAEQKYERTPLDTDQLFHTRPSNNWRLCYVAAGEIEAEDSGWDKITSTPGIYVLGKRPDRFYEVVIDEAYNSWLLGHNFQYLNKAEFELVFGHDPTQPTKTEVEIYGWGALYVRFLENAFKGIWSRRGRGLDSCLRSIAPSDLQTALEWAILSRDILTSKPLVQEKFTLCLVFLALSLLKDYNTPLAIQLLEKDKDKVLQAFRKDLADLFKAAECRNRKAKLHHIGLIRRAFMIAGGPVDVYQLKFDQEHTAIDNLNLLGSLVDVTGSDGFTNSDLQAILSALSRSKAITNEYIDTLDIAKLISQLMTLLPIGFQSNLGLPTKVPIQLPLSYKLRSPSTIYPLRVLGERIMKVKKGFSDRKLVNGDVVKLQLGGVVAGSTSQKLIRDANVCLPSPLKEDRLMTLFVDYDGWYKDHQGTRQRLSKEVMRVVQTMKVGQKVLIVEEKEDRNPEVEKDDRGKEARIWVVEVLQVLPVYSSHLSFSQNVPFHKTTLEEKLKMIKRSVYQRIRKKLEEPRVECSVCCLGRIFSSMRCKFLGKSFNRGYLALHWELLDSKN